MLRNRIGAKKNKKGSRSNRKGQMNLTSASTVSPKRSTVAQTVAHDPNLCLGTQSEPTLRPVCNGSCCLPRLSARPFLLQNVCKNIRWVRYSPSYTLSASSSLPIYPQKKSTRVSVAPRPPPHGHAGWRRCIRKRRALIVRERHLQYLSSLFSTCFCVAF